MKSYVSPMGWALGLSANLLFCAVGLNAAPVAPTPQIPEGGSAPGAFPNTSVSGINVIARGSTTFDSNVDVSGLEGQGPIPWSINRYNRGDIALRLSPGNPTAALGSLGQGFIEFADTSAGLPASHAWRPQPQFGVIIPTVRQNGPIDWNDGEGPFFPTVAVSESSSGPGFSMADGSYGNGDLDINTGRAGTHDSSPEANFSFSVAWFPYDAGWIGGEAAGPNATGGSSWTRPTAHSVGITPGMVRWTEFPAGSGSFGGVADIVLPGVNSLTNGMLFAASSDGGSDVNVVGLAPKEDGTGWTLTIREDSATDAETLAAADQSEFQFVYVPYEANNLIGGHINGQDAAKRTSRGDFTIVRTAAGIYDLTIPGKSGTNGMLVLQVADFEAGTSIPLASRAFLSYQFADGKFTIQSRKTSSDTAADLADTDFYFAWIDFQNPIVPPDAPRLRSLPTVAVTAEGVLTKEGNLAVNTDIPQVLVTTIDDTNAGGYTDPITGQFAQSALVGYFYNPVSFTLVGEPFVILGNPTGTITRHDVKYNPVSKQYVVVANARTYGANARSIPLLALVNTNAAEGATSPVAKTFIYDENTENNYDDVALAVSSKNGNILFAAEYSFPDEGEGVVGVLFDQTGNALTPQFGRLDLLQGAGDEDDPDVIYLESLDAFLYVVNTDLTGGLVNRVVGAIVQTIPGANGALQAQNERPLADGAPAGTTEGHPASFLNPFNGELWTAFDLGGNNVAQGQVSFTRIGTAPDYAFTTARPEINYLNGTAGIPFRHNHPQIAADTNSNVIAIGFNARQSDVGYPDAYVFGLFDENGTPLPGPLGTPYFLADAPGGIDQSVNLHNIKYSGSSDSFIVVYHTLPGVTYLGGFQVLSGEVTPPGDEAEVTARRVANGIELSWAGNLAGFVLESTPTLSAPAWTAVSGNPVPSGDRLTLTVTPEGVARFYRLRRAP